MYTRTDVESWRGKPTAELIANDFTDIERFALDVVRQYACTLEESTTKVRLSKDPESSKGPGEDSAPDVVSKTIVAKISDKKERDNFCQAMAVLGGERVRVVPDSTEVRVYPNLNKIAIYGSADKIGNAYLEHLFDVIKNVPKTVLESQPGQRWATR